MNTGGVFIFFWFSLIFEWIELYHCNLNLVLLVYLLDQYMPLLY